MLFFQKLFQCGGPPQTNRSSTGQQNEQAHKTGGPVECVLKHSNVGAAEAQQRRPAAWNGASPVVIEDGQCDQEEEHHDGDQVVFHDLRTELGIIVPRLPGLPLLNGNKVETRTKTAESPRIILLTMCGRVPQR